MKPAKLLSELYEQGISLRVDNGKLKLRPKSNIKPEQVEQLREHKAEIIHLLQPQKNQTTTAKGYGCAGCGNTIYQAVEAWETREILEPSEFKHEHKPVTNWQCERCGTVFEIINGTTGSQNLN